MNLKIRVLLLAFVMMLSVFYAGDASASSGSRTFVGCWTFYSAGQCRAVYVDQKGNYYLCGDCDSSGNPNSGNCSKISQQTLAQGYWCS